MPPLAHLKRGNIAWVLGSSPSMTIGGYHEGGAGGDWQAWHRLSIIRVVIPAQAGIQCAASAVLRSLLAGRTARCWIPACAGMTGCVELDRPKLPTRLNLLVVA